MHGIQASAASASNRLVQLGVTDADPASTAMAALLVLMILALMLAPLACTARR